MREAVLVDMIRTPFGRAGQRGVFRDISHVDLVIPLMKKVLDRNNVSGDEVDEVLWGSVGIAGMLTRSRHYVFEAGLPYTISATDMNKQCGSSLQASTQGAFAVMAGMSDIVLAGGVETMDRVNPIPPGDERNLQQIQTSEVMGREFLQPWPDQAKAPKWTKRWYQVTEPWIMDMGQTAEKLAKERGITREDADAFAYDSHKKAIRAQKEGLLADEIHPITIEYSDGSSVTVDKDQNPREDTTLEKLATLKPAYTAEGQVTAGNASPRTDGATICLIMEKETARQKGIKPAGHLPPRSQRRRRPDDHGHRAGAGHPEAAEAHRHEPRRLRSDRDQRGVRLPGARLRQRPRLGLEQGEPQRRRHRHRPPAGRQRHAPDRHDGLRDAAPRRRVGPGHAVHGRRHGHVAGPPARTLRLVDGLRGRANR